jgi:hypothetical protein
LASLAITLLVGLFTPACDSDGSGAGDASSDAGASDSAASETGAALGGLFVKVVDSNQRPVSDAVITTDPPTETRVTDALGSVLFSIPEGFYAVTASHPTAGAGRAPIAVVAGLLREVQVPLRAGAVVTTGAPTVTITTPLNGARFTRGTLVTLHATVRDDHDPVESLVVLLKSSLSGTLAEGHPSPSGIIDWAGALPTGLQTITLTATDSAGLSGAAAVSVVVQEAAPTPDAGADVPQAPTDTGPPAATVTLNPPVSNGNNVDLSWSVTPETGLASFRVYRGRQNGSLEIIDLINDPKARTYSDQKASFGVNYTYRVGALLANGQEASSNTVMITAGAFIAVNTQVAAMIVDRKRPYLYAVDSVNNQLLFVNLTTNMLEKTIFIGSKPMDLDISVSGDELFVANFGATELAVVNLETREKARGLTVNTKVGTWDGNPYRVACTAGNTAAFSSQDQWQDIKLVDGTTGANLSVTTGSIYSPDLEASPDGTRLYAAGDELVRFDVAAGKLTQVDSSGDRQGFGRKIAVSRNGMFVFNGTKKYLANNLKSVLGTFSETIFATNSDGSLAIGAANLHDGNTFAIIRPLPVMSSILALSADEATLYIYDTMSSRIYIYKVK